MADTKAQPETTKDEGKVAKSEVKTVGYFTLFRYATPFEKILYVFAVIFSTGHGAMMPVFSIIFGDITSDFTPTKSQDDIRRIASNTALLMFYVGLGTWGLAFLAAYSWDYLGNRINVRVRQMFFKSLVGQEMGWFDAENPEKMTTGYVENMHKFERAVGRQNHILIFSIAMSISGVVIGFVKGWWYALIVLLGFPIMMIGMISFLVVMQKESVVTKQNYEISGACSEQCFGAIKTVKSLNGEEHETGLYFKAIEAAKKASIKFGSIAGFCFGLFFMCIFICYGLDYWLGSVLVDRQVYNGNQKRDYDVTDVVTIFFSVITGAFAMGNTSPAAKALAMGQEAAYAIYEVIERKSKIPLDDPNAQKITSIEGDIEFENVEFNYPSRPETKILDGLTLKIPRGKKVALVGETGCGKSTTIQLIERYYDPLAGSVKLNGKDLKEINLASFRKHVGYVGQEPVLFAMSIRENLLMAKPTATEAELEDALVKANAARFVQKLEKKIDTYVGAGGSQLSGGQKQRIAIARSILQNPQILLLDEATSALDRRNEREIQETLDKLSKDRTTIIVAHRLSTIRNADIIYVLSKGKVVESGSHTELLEKNGAYAKLVQIQMEGLQHEMKDPQLLAAMSRKLSESPELMKHESTPGDIKLFEAGQAAAAEEEDEVKKSDELTDEQKKALAIEDDKKRKLAAKRMTGYLKGNVMSLIGGIFFSICSGCLMPVFAIFLADMIDVLSKFAYYQALGYSRDSKEWQDNRDQALYIGGYFLIMAVISLITNFCQLSLLNALAQTVTSKIRVDLYKHFLTRDMEFFDNPKNSPGELSSVLAKDCLTVNTIVSGSYGAMFNAFGSFGCGIVIAMIASWKLALVSLSVSPLIVISGIVESQIHKPKDVKEIQDSKESKTFQEVCTNMKTVNSLFAQPTLIPKFEKHVSEENNISGCKMFTAAMFYGIGQFSMFAVYALTFYAGAVFTQTDGLSFKNMFRALFAIIFAAFGAGMGQQFAGNIGAAEVAAKKIFDYMDIQNKMVVDANGAKPEVEGTIEFRNVKFTYPQRKLPCFTDLSFKISPKQKIAFAGPSGTGKSTIFSLLYRFYDVDSGEILLDGKNIKEYDIHHLRASLGMVAQEPVLFNNTIRYNIKYNQQERTDTEMMEATRIANATKFIETDAQENEERTATSEKTTEDDGKGYDRKVGLKGGKLSGGQKQRVAIARTVIRRPNIYMFDESTSALDTESEKIVQEALNRISESNTTLSIAHRVSTIKDCDVIFVIEAGKVVEQGKYSQLMEKKGVFYQLNKDK